MTVHNELALNGSTVVSPPGLTVKGDFNLNGSTITAPSGTLTVAGDFTNTSGTFTHNSGTLSLNGTSQTVSGNTSFNNFTKTTSSADTLTFTASSTQTIAGTLTLQGASGNLLTLVSSSSGTRWNIVNTGDTESVSYVDVQDSNNTGSTITAVDSVDSGNNIGWDISTSTQYCYWVGDTSPANWNEVSHWSNASGGTPSTCDGGTVPDTDDNVIFDGGSVNTVTVDADINVASLNLQSGYAGTFDNATGDRAVTVSGNVIMDNNRTDMGDATWTVSGDFDNQDVTTFNRNLSTLVMTGSGKNLISNGTTSARQLHHVTISAGASILVPNSSNEVYIYGTFTVNGTLDITVDKVIVIYEATADLKLTSTGLITGDGTFIADYRSKITQKDAVMDVANFHIRSDHGTSYPILPATYESANVRIYNYGPNTYYFRPTSGGTYTFLGDVLIEGNISSSEIYVIGYSTQYNYNFVFQQNLTLTNNLANLTFYTGTGSITVGGNLIADNYRILATSTSTINVTGDVILDGNTVTMSSSTWTVGGTFDNKDVTTFTYDTSTVILTGSGKELIGGGFFKNLTIAEGASITVPSSSNYTGGFGLFTIAGTLSIESGEIFSMGAGGDLKLTSTGLITGGGTFRANGGSTITQKDGVMDVENLEIMKDHTSSYPILATTYESANVLVCNDASTSYNWYPSAGTYTFLGNVTFTGNTSSTGTYTINNYYNPNFVFKGNVTVDNGTSTLNWTKGTGTITFAKDSGTQTADFLSKGVEDIIVGSGTTTNTLQLTGNVTTDQITVNSGVTLDLNGNNLSYPSSLGTYNDGTIRLQGNETLTNVANLDTDSGTVEYYGTGTYNPITYVPSYNVDFVSAGSFTLPTSMNVYGNFTVDGSATVIGASPGASTLNIYGNFTNTSGTVTAPSGTLAVAGNFTNSATFTHNSGTVVLFGSNQTVSGSTTFNNFYKASSLPDTLTFEASSTQTVLSNLSLNGANGSNLLSLRSSNPGTRWNIIHDGVDYIVNFTDIQDSNHTGGPDLNALNSTDSLNNIGWLFSSGDTTITLSGTLYSNEGTTAIDCSTPRTIAVVVDGGIPVYTTCTNSPSNGSYTIDILPPSADSVINVFVAFANEKAVTVTKALNSSSNITANLYQDRLILTHESANPITNADLAIYDYDQDADVFYTSNSNNFSLNNGYKLYLLNNKTYTPGGTVTTSPSESQTTTDGDIYIGTGATLNMEANPLYIGGDYTNAGTFSYTGDQTSYLTATHTTFHLISCGASYFNHLEQTGSGYYENYATLLNVAGNLTLSAGAYRNEGGNAHVVVLGNVTVNNGTSIESGTWTISGNFDYSNAVYLGYGINGRLVMNGINKQIISNGTALRYLTIAENAIISVPQESSDFDVSRSLYIYGTLDITANRTLSSITYNANLHIYAGGILTGEGTFVFDSGSELFTFDASGVLDVDNLIIKGDHSIPDYDLTSGTYGSANVTFYNDTSTNYTCLFPAGTFTFLGDVSFIGNTAAGLVTYGTQTINNSTSNPNFVFKGNVTIDNGQSTLNWTKGTGTITFAKDSGTQTADFLSKGVEDIIVGSGTTTNTLQLTGNVTTDQITVNSGATLDLNGNNLSYPSSQGTYNDGTILMQGEETLTNVSNLDTDSGTVEYYGTGSYATLPYTGNYYNINFTGSGSYTLPTNLTALNDFTLNGSTITAPSGTLTVAGDFTNTSGTFTHNSGTLSLNGTSQTVSGNTSFNNFTKTTSSADTLTFTASSTQTIAGTLTLQGASGNLLTLVSSSSGTRWNITVNGSSTVSYVNVSDSDASLGNVINAAGGTSVDGGNNLNWLFDGIAITGTIYTDEGVTPLDCTTPRTIAISDDGASPITTTCSNSPSTGSFSTTSQPIDTGSVLVVFIDGATEKATTVTRTATDSGSITINLFQNRAVIHHEDTGPITNANIGTYDYDNDTDILYTSNSNNLTLNDGYKLFIADGTTYTPGGTITTSPSSDSATTDGDIYIDSTATLNMQANALSIGGDYVNDGTFSYSSTQTTTLTATTTGHSLDSGTSSWYNITTSGTGGWITSTDTLNINGNLTLATGTFDNATNDATINVTGNVTMDNTQTDMGDATWTVDGNWDNEHITTFNRNVSTLVMNGTGKSLLSNGLTRGLYNLTIPITLTTTVSPSANGFYVYGNLLNNGTLSVDNGATLHLYSAGANLAVAGSGALTGEGTFVANHQSQISEQSGTFDVSNFHIASDHVAPYAIVPATYGSATVTIYNNTNNGAYFVPSSGTYIFLGDVDFLGNNGASGVFTIDNATYNPNFVFEGNVTVDNGTSTLNWTKGTGTITFSGTSAQTADFLDKSVEDIVISNTTDTVSLIDNGVTTDQLTVDSGATFDLNGENLSYPSSVGTYNDGTILMQGNETLTNVSNLDTDSGTVEYYGTGSYNPIAYVPSYNVVFSGAGSFTFPTNANVYGDFTLNGSTITAPSGTLTVAGDFTNTSGTFTHNSGTLSLNGTGQTVSGNTSFNNFTKITSSADTLTFTASSTQTIAGTLTLQGASGNLLTLVSSSSGTRWNIVNTGDTESVSYVDVQDSNNTGSTITATDAVDAGNNIGWEFIAGTTTCYWVGATDPANWNESANWSSTSGGAGNTCNGGTVPGITNDVVLDSANTNSVIFNADSVRVHSLYQEVTYTGTIYKDIIPPSTVTTTVTETVTTTVPADPATATTTTISPEDGDDVSSAGDGETRIVYIPGEGSGEGAPTVVEANPSDVVADNVAREKASAEEAREVQWYWWIVIIVLLSLAILLIRHFLAQKSATRGD